MSANIKLKDETQFLMYLKSSKVSLDDFTYNEDPSKNKYGIKDIIPYMNPYLWNVIAEKNLYSGIEFLLDVKPEWLTSSVGIGILQSFQIKLSKDNIINTLMNKLFTRLWVESSEETKENSIDGILLAILTENRGRLKFLKKAIDFIEKYNLKVKEDGAFIRACLTELAKTNDRDSINYLISKFPSSLTKGESWPYLIAIKYGNYELALFFASKGMDIHAKGDLGYKLLERNYKRNLVNRVGDTKKAEEHLMDLYLRDEKHTNKA